ncbi:MAG TPA: DUF4147 domain-containing protein [Gammaproteobacteria bacterium]|nr:DUF4147 domain-containing protein [Gammaproteobacteria bacterium]
MRARSDLSLAALGVGETRILLGAFERAVAAASAFECLHIRPEALRGERVLVLGTGKAAAEMALACAAAARGRARGLVVTRYGHGLEAGEDAGGIEVLEAGHPAPDSASVLAAQRMMTLARELGPEDSLCFLVSGGGSALLAAPLPGITLEHKRTVAAALMHAGADIREINVVRKHLSAIKGGRLAALAHPARVHTFAISDVPGDAIADIASGPTIPDPSTQAQALEILARYECPIDPAVRAVLTAATNETPKPGEPGFGADCSEIVANARTALDAAELWLEAAGYAVERLGDDLADAARALGAAHGRLALDRARAGRRCALLSGGETRVVVGNPRARGGRNLEYLASLALTLDGAAGIHALAADTDGIDGNGDHAGAVIIPDLLRRGRSSGADLAAALESNSTYDYFDRCKLLLKTGPTRTNVNDFRLILVDGTASR